MPKYPYTPRVTLHCRTCALPFIVPIGVAKGGRKQYCSRKCKAQRGSFWERIVKTETCWLWVGAKQANGYGLYQKQRAHRVSFVKVHGPIPPGLCVCHKCDNPPCVNPEHLFLGTRAENTYDRDQKGRTAKGEKHYLTQRRIAGIVRKATCHPDRKHYSLGFCESCYAKQANAKHPGRVKRWKAEGYQRAKALGKSWAK